MIDVNLSPGSTDIRKLRRLARSKIKFDTIKEVLVIYNEYKENWSPGYFASILNDNGWEHIGDGLYKECWGKNSIVVKFSREIYHQKNSDEATKELAREYDQYFNPECSGLRKYLPKIYAFIDNTILIQDRILGKCISDFNIQRGYKTCTRISEVEKIAVTYNLQDYYQNHGHTSKGNIKFFDSVWFRWRKI